MSDLPNLNITTSEIATGRTYCGSPTYICAFQGSIIASSSNFLDTELAANGISRIVSFGGGWQDGYDNIYRLLGSLDPESLTTFRYNSILFVGINNDLVLRTISDNNRDGDTNSAYDIWVEYTKTT